MLKTSILVFNSLWSLTPTWKTPESIKEVFSVFNYFVWVFSSVPNISNSPKTSSWILLWYVLPFMNLSDVQVQNKKVLQKIRPSDCFTNVQSFILVNKIGAIVQRLGLCSRFFNFPVHVIAAAKRKFLIDHACTPYIL